MDVILINLPGTMKGGGMPGRPATPERANWRMIGVIVDAPAGAVFFKATGPDATIASHYDRVKEFAMGLRAK
jgi:hypothetical protein